MLDKLYWLAVSAFFGVPFFASLYVVVTPTHKLIENWQNWKISRSHRPLKDEHFKSLPRAIVLWKVLAFVIMLAALAGLVMVLLSLTSRPQY
jgi:hypothetical protein